MAKLVKNQICYRKKDNQIGHICDMKSGVYMWWPYNGKGMELLYAHDLRPAEPLQYYHDPFSVGLNG